MGNLWARHAAIHQHWDPRYRPHEVPEGELRIAYLGTRRSLAFWHALPDVEYIEDGWFERAPGFNAHLSVRTTRKGWRYKPGAKVVTAAACGAVLLTTPDDASVELLGEDYPFYVEEVSREGIQATIARAREALGGPAWRLALERLREIKETHTLERVSQRYVELFDELA